MAVFTFCFVFCYYLGGRWKFGNFARSRGHSELKLGEKKPYLNMLHPPQFSRFFRTSRKLKIWLPSCLHPPVATLLQHKRKQSFQLERCMFSCVQRSEGRIPPEAEGSPPLYTACARLSLLLRDFRLKVTSTPLSHGQQTTDTTYHSLVCLKVNIDMASGLHHQKIDFFI